MIAARVAADLFHSGTGDFDSRRATEPPPFSAAYGSATRQFHALVKLATFASLGAGAAAVVVCATDSLCWPF
jgi:hypothetical protein